MLRQAAAAAAVCTAAVWEHTPAAMQHFKLTYLCGQLRACAHGYTHNTVHKPAFNTQSQLQGQIGPLECITATPAARPAAVALHKGWRLWRAALLVQEQQRRLLARPAHAERPRRSHQP